MNTPKSRKADRRKQKDRIYEQLARAAKAAASPKRIEILELLSQAPRTVEALAEQAQLTVANTSRHLQVLRASRLVEADKRGLFVEYRLSGEEVVRFTLALRRVAEAQLIELEAARRAYVGERESMEPVKADELARRVRSGEVTVIDVRPEEEYRAGHLPGAISLPIERLADGLDQIPKRKEVVAYCRGPYCVMAADALAVLEARGYRAQRLEEGVNEWRARGWRVETGQKEARR